MKELDFKKIRIDINWLALKVSGMGMGTERALEEYSNGFSVSVIKGSYLCTKNTFEVGILFKDKLAKIEDLPELHKFLTENLKLQPDGSEQLVYKHVSKTKVDKVRKYIGGLDEKY